jgi:transcriptional regulator with XRE-family HTH domain
MVTKGENFERLVLRAGFRSMRELSRACGVAYGSVRNIASGQRDGHVRTFFAMADAIAEGLGVSRAEAMERLRQALE